MFYLTRKIAEGSERDVYLHPEDPDAVIKVAKHASIRRNLIDYHCLRQVNPEAQRVLPNFVGWVETNHGQGAIFEMIRDSDGSISRPLIDRVTAGQISEAEGRALIIDFFKVAIANRLPMHDVNFHNLLVQESGAGRRLILVDGFGPQREDFKAYLRSSIRFLYLYKALKTKRKALREWKMACAALQIRTTSSGGPVRGRFLAEPGQRQDPHAEPVEARTRATAGEHQ